MRVNPQDAAAGAIFLVLGGAFALGATMQEIGTPLRMGPGFFPLVLGLILAALGAIIAMKSLAATPLAFGPVPWRGLAFILAGPIVFGLLLRGIGLVPSVALVVLLAAYASRRMSHRLAIMLTVGLTLFCVAVFSYALGLPIARFGPWLRFG